jgi:hypothetical protein
VLDHGDSSAAINTKKKLEACKEKEISVNTSRIVLLVSLLKHLMQKKN